MEILGLGILGGCMIAGLFMGNLLGKLVGLNSDVGGVGFAMLFLVFLSNYLELKGKPLPERVGRGIEFIARPIHTDNSRDGCYSKRRGRY